MVACIVQRLHRRLISLLENHHTSSLTYRPWCKCVNQSNKCFNTRFIILRNKKKLQPCWNASSSGPKVNVQKCPNSEKHCIISWWLMISLPCEPSATNHTNCVLIALTRRHRNCYCFVPNVFYHVGMTEILILIDIVCDVGKPLETPGNLILYFLCWHCTPLGQAIQGLGFWLQVFHHSLDRHFS